MNVIYDEMTQRNRLLIAEEGFSHDPALLAKEDMRRCLALYSFGTYHPSHNMMRLREFDKEGFIYEWDPNVAKDVPRFHHTFLQLVTFGHEVIYQTYMQDPAFKEALVSYMSSFPVYTIHYTRLVAVPTGVILVGIPSVDLNALRDELRWHMVSRGFPVIEAYTNNIAHGTLLRLHSPLSPKRQKQLLDLVDSLNAACTDYGSLVVSDLLCSLASWKMTREEVVEF